MRRFSILAAFGLTALTALVATGCTLLKPASRPAPDFPVDRSPAAVKRGAYLANHVNACMTCHSGLDAEHHPIPGEHGVGGRHFAREDGLPGDIWSTNLTPDPETGIGSWTDGELARAIREGVSRDGHALFPLMPYPNYRTMSDADTAAIIAYMRSLPATKKPVPARTLDFPVSVIVNTIPKPLDGPVAPTPTHDPVAYGKHLVTQASCAECHTPMGAGGPDTSRYLAGGHAFKDGTHAFTMPNLTPTGLKGWSDAQVEAALRFGQRPDGRRLSPVMPWMAYNKLSKDDMAAMIAYLRTVPALETKKP